MHFSPIDLEFLRYSLLQGAAYNPTAIAKAISKKYLPKS